MVHGLATRAGRTSRRSFGDSLVEKSLLFLGFRLDDWDFRVVFQAIKSFGGSQLMDRTSTSACS